MALQVLDQYIGITAASHLLGLSTVRVQQLADSGAIKAVRDPSGRRLLVRRSVEDLAQKRAIAHAAAAGAVGQPR